MKNTFSYISTIMQGAYDATLYAGEMKLTTRPISNYSKLKDVIKDWADIYQFTDGLYKIVARSRDEKDKVLTFLKPIGSLEFKLQ